MKWQKYLGLRGGELAHKFDKNNMKKLDNEKRRLVMPPLKTLEVLGFTEKTDMADIGCGIGYFSIPAAQIGGISSNIYALDISEDMLNEVEKRALEAGVSNVNTIKVDEYDLKLHDQSVGFALLCNVLHEIDEKGRFISEISRILLNGGKLAIIDWEKRQTESGPPVEHRISYQEVSDILVQNGYEIVEKNNIGQDHYGITAVKK